ncbi:MAG: HAD-IIIA family hydrolase [Planctomycetota bacterium]|nr:HAD-IIIA family hydrolase [Planctomycetota bacterium]MDI6786813.1 HAD-IIIA family hydrolase [Planctomycetota bacterium]
MSVNRRTTQDASPAHKGGGRRDRTHNGGASDVKMVIMDVDGVLSDGSIIFDTKGVEYKVFNIYDGAGIVYLHRAGLKTAIISGRSSKTVLYRLKELGMTEIHQNAKQKIEPLNKILAKYRLSFDEVCYIGDDLPDIPVMKQVGYAVAVRNARPEVKKYAHFITKNHGGKGAVREVAEKILKAQNKWKTILQRYDTIS